MEEKQELEYEQLSLDLGLPEVVSDEPQVPLTQDQPLVDFDEFFKEDEDKKEIVPYTTELLNNIQELDPSLTIKEAEELLGYLKGSSRPEFMEKMLTQTNEKLIESIKVMAILYLNRVPVLLDYQSTLQKNLIDIRNIKDMSYDEISKVSANVQREINELLTFSLNVAKSLSNVNSTPTKVEKLANALMSVSETTRNRIEEILRYESQE